MDISALSMSLSEMKVAQEVSVSVMKLAMDTEQGQMQDFTKIMEQSVNPNLGTSIDVKG